jgi:hypothetical protein
VVQSTVTIERRIVEDDAVQWTARYRNLPCAADDNVIRLFGHYPDLSSLDRAVVDGEVVDVLAVEHDARSALSQLIVERRGENAA